MHFDAANATPLFQHTHTTRTHAHRYASWNEHGGGIRPGTAPGSMGDVPGFEFAGTVAAVGSDVMGFAVGDPVRHFPAQFPPF